MLGKYLELIMSETVRHLLDLFDALPEQEKRSAVLEILRRSVPVEADITVHELNTLADELFSALDSEESARATDR
jgi:hypothetical protein